MCDIKRQNQKNHFKNRFKERFGKTINRIEYKEIVDRIKSGEYKLIQEQSNRVQVYQGLVKGHDIQLVFDKKRQTIVTCMSVPEEYLVKTSG